MSTDNAARPCPFVERRCGPQAPFFTMGLRCFPLCRLPPSNSQRTRYDDSWTRHLRSAGANRLLRAHPQPGRSWRFGLYNNLPRLTIWSRTLVLVGWMLMIPPITPATDGFYIGPGGRPARVELDDPLFRWTVYDHCRS